MLGCTILTNSYLAQGRVLEASFREHNPDADFLVLNLDDGPPDFVDEDEFLRMAGMYAAQQLAGAMRSRLLLDQLAEHEVAVYLDSDIEVFSPLDVAHDLAREHGLVLTPHMLAADPIFEPWILRGGTLNSGFVAATSSAAGFLNWWATRTARYCIKAPEQGYLSEQRWLDLAPAFAAAHVLRDPGYNVMGWNLHERRIDFPTVNGRPLVFFHFCSGFDPHQPERLATMPNLPWPPPEEPVRALCRAYGRRVLDAGYDECRKRPYRYAAATDVGLVLDRRMRAAYRAAVLEFEAGHGHEPPNPFRDGPGFVDWLLEPIDSAGVNRYLAAVRAERVDLLNAFPEVPGAHSAAYMHWVRFEPANLETIPELFR